MRVIKAPDNAMLSQYACDMIVDTLHSYNRPVLGLATGSSPEETYRYLVERYRQGEVCFSNAISFNLDDYVGLSPQNPFSYHYYMEKHLFGSVNIKRENVYIPNGLAEDLDGECAKFERAIEAIGPIHLQLLGVGLNGHIGFNEPYTSFDARTHVATLSESTRRVNARFFNSVAEVPTEALTMGIGTIMEAEQIVLLVQGERKRGILERIVYGEVTEAVPATVLQNHPQAVIITDIDL